jgi:hypothetical protein
MADVIYTGGPAFPQHGWSTDPETIQRMQAVQGLTIRDYFAGVSLPQAMAQVWHVVCNSQEVAAAAATDEGLEILLQRVAYMSYAMADAMLAERKKARGE